MVRAIELKSVVVGGLLVLLVVAVMGAVPDVHHEKHGRFSLAVSPTTEAYVLDTATGQVWSQSTDWQEFYAAKTYDDPNQFPPSGPAVTPRRR